MNVGRSVSFTDLVAYLVAKHMRHVKNLPTRKGASWYKYFTVACCSPLSITGVRGETGHLFRFRLLFSL